LNGRGRPPTVPPMVQSCVRCPAPAAVVMTFDYDERAVWLIDFEELVDHDHGYPLCGNHGDRITPPLGWTLTDRRNVTRLFSPTAPSEVA
jgi:hypothetical protein